MTKSVFSLKLFYSIIITNARVNEFLAPWLIVTLKISIKERDKAHSEYRNGPTIENRNYWKELRNFVKASV